MTLYNDSRVTVYTTSINEGGVVFIHSILEICGVTLEDSDYYTCVAENAFGYDYSSFTVEVVDTGMYVYVRSFFTRCSVESMSSIIYVGTLVRMEM